MVKNNDRNIYWEMRERERDGKSESERVRDKGSTISGLKHFGFCLRILTLRVGQGFGSVLLCP